MSGTTRPTIPIRPVGAIAEFGRRLLDPVPGYGANKGRRVEGTRDGRRRNPGPLCDGVDSDRHLAPRLVHSDQMLANATTNVFTVQRAGILRLSAILSWSTPLAAGWARRR